MDITELLKFTIAKGGSDLHITPGQSPRMRIDGSIKPISAPPLSEEEARKIIYSIMNDSQRHQLEKHLDVDFAITLGDESRFRVNAFYTSRGLAAAFRPIPIIIRTLEELGLPEIIGQIIVKERGLILLTGTTGSGKSTTMAAMVDRINSNNELHILTIEDPIEFIHKPRKSLINHREVGTHAESFQRSLRAALREDPDVILVGEMRDLETIHLALTAAETGHLVIATLHTASAPKTIDRIIDAFPAAQQSQVRSMISESLQAIITQTLCPKIQGGLCVALEVLIGTPAVRNLIRENKIHQLTGIMQTSGLKGMKTKEAHLIELFENGVISEETAIAKSGDPDLLLTRRRQ